MFDLQSCLCVVGLGAFFGFGIRWGFWIYDGFCEILRDLFWKKP